jgi:hypothetical protein
MRGKVMIWSSVRFAFMCAIMRKVGALSLIGSWREMLLRFSRDRVNQYVLRRQHLTPEARGTDILSVVRDTGPIRATPTLTPYLSFWSRIKDFARPQLDTTLYEQRMLVRIPCMHARLYLVPVEDLVAYHRCNQPTLQQGLQDLDDLFAEAHYGSNTSMPLYSSDLARRVLEVMNTRGPCTVAELSEWLPVLKARILHDPDNPSLGHTSVGARLIPAMCADGLLVRAQTRGGWRSDLYSYATLGSWLPGIDLQTLSPEEALQHIALAYVRAYGPVTVGDVLHWLGETTRQRAVAALMTLGHRLTRLEIADSSGDYMMLQDQVDALVNYCPQERSVCLLPPRDSYVMAYSDTSRFLAETYREFAFDRAGESLGTVWVEGNIVGVWWLHIKEGRITVRTFEALDPEALALIGEEARRLAKFLDFATLDLEIGPYSGESSEEESMPVVVVQADSRRA